MKIDGILKITRIRVADAPSVPPGKADNAREALETCTPQRPAAMNVGGCVEIVESAEISELPA